MKHLEGLIAAPFTPFHKDGSLHLDMIPAYYQMLQSNKVTGAFICGSTGEGVSLSLEEKKLVMIGGEEKSLINIKGIGIIKIKNLKIN